MPFAVQRCLVAGVLKNFRKGNLLTVKVLIETADAVFVTVQSGQNCGPAGRANGIGAKTVVEFYALFGKAINIDGPGILGKQTVVAGNRLRRVIIPHNK